MSLAQAPKDISDHPAKGSVVDPVNKEKQAADVDRKLRLYGVINAFKEYRMPTNAQIDKTLNYVLNHSPVPEKDLSPEGRQLISDTRDIIETARLIVQEKNKDELFQNFIWHTRDTDFSKAKKDPSDVAPVDSDKAKSDGQQAVTHLRTLLSLILTNAEVRKLLSDFSVIGRDLLARGASKVAESARPDEEELRQVNDSAPNDRFVTEGGRHAGPDETPVRTTSSQYPLLFNLPLFRSSKPASREQRLPSPNIHTKSSDMARQSSKTMVRKNPEAKPLVKLLQRRTNWSIEEP